MKATNLIRHDHENLKALFDKYKQSAGRQQNGRKSLCHAICKELEIHSDLERNLFYPELENTSSSHMTELLRDAEKAHGTMDDLIARLRSSNGNEKEAERLMEQLIESASEHFDVEEAEILEEARQLLSEPKLEELGLELEHRRKLLTQLAA